MNILQNLQDMLGQAISGNTAGRPSATSSGSPVSPGTSPGADSIFGGLSNILNGGLSSLGGAGGASKILTPAAIGGLLGALLSSKAARGMAGGAILAGGGSMLWDKFKNRMRQEDASSGSPLFGDAAPASPADLDARSLRLVRALIFAARSDGHVDDAEEKAIRDEVGKLGLGAEGEALIRKTLAEPLDPAGIAAGVTGEDEALEIFTLSRAVIDPDQFMEQNYLQALAKALHIPDDVRDQIMRG